MDDYVYKNEFYEFRGKTIERMYFLGAEGDDSFHLEFTDGTDFELMYLELEHVHKPKELHEKKRWAREGSPEYLKGEIKNG